MTTRRDFIRQAALLGAGLSMNPFFIKASSNSVGANDKIRVGLIGCKGMGYSDLQAFLRNPEVECIALADIDENVLNNRAAETEKLTGKKVKHLYKDWRKLIDNKDVDVVIIGTPDHWHCLQMVAACEAGKDVYCEKPLGNSIEECNIMVRAAEKYNRVVQVGQWQRSDPHWQDAMAFVHSGQLGKIRTVRVFSYQGWCPSIPVVADEPVPAGVDYDMWLGPAPYKPYNIHRTHQTFRGYWDYDGGGLADMGQHYIDPVQYMLGKDDTSPVKVEVDAPQQHPDAVGTWRKIIYTYDDGCQIVLEGEGYESKGKVPYMEGPNGKVYQGFEVELNGQPAPDIMNLIAELPDPEPQNTDFIKCLKDRQKFALNEDNGFRSSTIVNMGVCALRLNRTLEFDPVSMTFVNDDEANRLIDQPCRDGWKV